MYLKVQSVKYGNSRVRKGRRAGLLLYGSFNNTIDTITAVLYVRTYMICTYSLSLCLSASPITRYHGWQKQVKRGGGSTNHDHHLRFRVSLSGRSWDGDPSRSSGWGCDRSAVQGKPQGEISFLAVSCFVTLKPYITLSTLCICVSPYPPTKP